MSDTRDPKIDDAFTQLDGALCIWSRAKGEQPLKQYIEEVTPNTRRVLIGDTVFVFTVTVAEDQ